MQNEVDINGDIFNYNQEQVDTGIVLEALNITKRNPFSDLVSFSSIAVRVIPIRNF